MSIYIEEALWIANLVINKLADADNLLPTRIDCQTGEIIDDKRMVDDLGDYVQYIWFLGKITDNEKLMDFAVTSVYKAAHKYQDQSGLFKSGFLRGAQLHWYSNEDVFFGLTALYRLTKDNHIEEIISRFWRGLAKYARQSGLLVNATRGLNKYLSSPPRTYVEGLIFSYLINNSEEFLYFARKLTEPWINSRFFNKHGLFPATMLSIEYLNNINCVLHDYNLKNLSRFGQCSIPKTNTNFLHGILELWKVTKDEQLARSMRQWIESVENNLFIDGLYPSKFNVYTREWSHSRKAIWSFIAITGFYADFCNFYGDQSILDKLKTRLNDILKSQSDIGLFRDAPHDPDDAKYNRGWIDNQTDMSVVLLKTYCLTQNKIYLEKAKLCIDSVIKYLKRPYGYIEYFNVSDGSMDHHSRMFTKMLTLFMKALLILDAVLAGKDVFHDDIFIISGDR